MALGKAGRAQGKGIAEGAQGGAVRILGRAEGLLLGMQGFGLSGQFGSTSDEHGFILASIHQAGKFDQIYCCLFACQARRAVPAPLFAGGEQGCFAASPSSCNKSAQNCHIGAKLIG